MRSRQPVSPVHAVEAASPVEAEYWNVAQVSLVLGGVKRKTILGWAQTDATMPKLKIGKTVLFPRTRLLAWLRQREQGRPVPLSRTPSLSAVESRPTALRHRRGGGMSPSMGPTGTDEAAS